jgi:alpha-tubulin suppressor-like RCC1 family protein
MSNSNDPNTSRRAFVRNILASGVTVQTGVWSSLVGALSTIVSDDANAQIQSHSFWKKKAAGGNYAFGQNTYGAWGDGTTTTNSSGRLIGTTSWTYLVSGDQFAIGLKPDGTLWGTGKAATYGMLGQNNKTNRSSWVQIGTGKSFTQVTASAQTVHAIATDGQMWAWGNNSSRKLANGNSTSVSSPVQVLGTNSWAQVSSSNNATIAIRNDGLLFCAGDYSYTFELGIGDPAGVTYRSSFVQIGTKSWSQISSGNQYTLAIDTAGALHGWGTSEYHETGLGTNLNYPGPISPTQFATGFSKVSAGSNHCLGIKTDGTMWSWGLNSFGQNGTIGSAGYSPQQVPGTYTRLTNNMLYFLTGAIKSSAGASTWGENLYGGMGINSNNNYKLSPVQVVTHGSSFVQISSGTYHTMGINQLGQLFGTGGNFAGQLGNGASSNKNSPVQIAGSWTQVMASLYFTAGIRSDGTLWSWGWNSTGELGNSVPAGQDSSCYCSSPVQVTVANSWSQVSTGYYHMGAISTTGALYLTGLGYDGQLGNGSSNYITTLTQVGTSSWSQVSCGSYHTLAIGIDGSLWGTGWNAYGQLGNNGTSSRSTLVQIGTQSWSQISAGNSNSAAIRSDGTLWVWGDNTKGQLARDTTLGVSSPVQVAGSWTQIVCGYDSMIGMKTDGTVWSWGGNGYGCLGTNADHITMKAIPGSWIQAFAGFAFSVALRNDYTLWAWGFNLYGQLGQGDTSSRYSPVQISGSWTMLTGSTSYGDFFQAKKI